MKKKAIFFFYFNRRTLRKIDELCYQGKHTFHFGNISKIVHIDAHLISNSSVNLCFFNNLYEYYPVENNVHEYLDTHTRLVI